MDGHVNFFNWGYTTVAGSRFDNMQIDLDGDYLVKRSDMNFQLYDIFKYQTKAAIRARLRIVTMHPPLLSSRMPSPMP